jgi:16S rRNA (cytosine967-C5)-methyltransferase
VKPGIQPRLAAARVVGRVLREGAWTQQALSSATAAMTPIDRKQAEGLGYGTIRRLAQLDWRLGLVAGRSLSEIDPPILDALRVGAFEVMFGRAPTPVVVSTSVEVARELNPRVAGFVNAVLRELDRSQPPLADPELARSHDMALPAWLLRSLDRAWGPVEAAAFALASLQDAPVVVRQGSSASPVVGRPVPGIAGAFEVEPSEVRHHPRQDPSSIAVGLSVRADPGHVVVDVAAAPGGKTLHLLDQVGPSGHVVALDHHHRRLRAARKRVPRASWILADGTLPPLRRRSFDRVLIDAPCSGLGTLRRRPEIRHRVTPAEVERLADLQRRLLMAGLELVRPGGSVTYSVCTVTPEETVEVIAELGASPPSGLPGRVWGSGWLLGPHLTASDGMFIAVIAT